MKQSLELKVGQQLTMTPQLQQAIRLLQLPTLELREEIQQALDSNLMLESADEPEAEASDTSDVDGELSEGDAAPRQGDSGEASATAVDASTNDDDTSDAQGATDWEEHFTGSAGEARPESDYARDPIDNTPGHDGSLREHLLWQARLSGLGGRDEAIAATIIDAIGDDGYLALPLADIRDSLPAAWELTEADVYAVLCWVQHLDPVGVGARHAGEALRLQLEQLPPHTAYRETALALVTQYLELLVNRQYAQLKRRMKLDQPTLQAAVDLIQTLNPRPGSQIVDRDTAYVIPDVVVERGPQGWRVELNEDACPKLRVNDYYASLVRRADNSRDNTMMRQHLQEARWFIKSLRSRHDTLLKVAQCIVDRQGAFLSGGEEAMQPLVLREVAEHIEMHESTVSRITNQKYMRTPRGTLEFKYFFSSHVQTTDGGECSATAIRARIRRLLASEEPTAPLSDSRLAEILKTEGINVARRTVAKYREAMGIGSSTERRRLA